MIRNLCIERMKLVGHVEEQERNAFALVLARSDRRLGPSLKPSDCVAPPATPGVSGLGQNWCGGYSINDGALRSAGITIDQLSRALRGPAGALVNNRTALDGNYAVELRFAAAPLNSDASASTGDAPQLVTALQEQLGLKLVPEKTKVKIFVVDHIERPTPN